MGGGVRTTGGGGGGGATGVGAAGGAEILGPRPMHITVSRPNSGHSHFVQ